MYLNPEFQKQELLEIVPGQGSEYSRFPSEYNHNPIVFPEQPTISAKYNHEPATVSHPKNNNPTKQEEYQKLPSFATDSSASIAFPTESTYIQQQIAALLDINQSNNDEHTKNISQKLGSDTNNDQGQPFLYIDDNGIFQIKYLNEKNVMNNNEISMKKLNESSSSINVFDETAINFNDNQQIDQVHVSNVSDILNGKRNNTDNDVEVKRDERKRESSRSDREPKLFNGLPIFT